MNPQEPPSLTVARILRPHGRRGEVAAEILTDFPERLARLSSVELWDGRSVPHHAVVRSCWLSRSRGGQAIFHFQDSGSISDAERLVGLEVRIPWSARTPLPSGTYYVAELIGCEIRESDGDTIIGRVSDVQFTGEDVAGTPVLIADSPQGELLIPLAQDICVKVDTGVRRIEVILPEGLRDLNRD